MTMEAGAMMYRVDGRELLRLVPRLDQNLLRDVRQEVARHSRSEAATWQEVWNEATGATPDRPGYLRFWAQVRCRTCNGRRFTHTGPCYDCMGQGKKNDHVRQTALYAAVPEPKSQSAPQP